ncbi:MAG: Na/Pi symporter [Deltaproteobacteria bacterium]|nr:Na/Pi symporter [Deltaproteobacteria bacterium]
MHPTLKKALHVLEFLAVLYLFFLCIEMMGGSFKLFGKDAARSLMVVTDNPIVGLMIGVLATSIVQSSSTTTSIVVGMVAAGTLSISQAVPMVMGANIGTTITSVIVSLGHLRRRREFELAFAGATVHDFFNLLAVTLFLPLEWLLHPIQSAATWISSLLVGVEGATFSSPLKAIVKPLVELLQQLGERIWDNQVGLGVVFILLALGLLIFSLSRMVCIMRGALAKRLEVLVDHYLFTSVMRAFVIGILVTAIVQSSSVTTSLVVPMLGAGIIRVERVFPYMVGANIGTTITALLASFVTGCPAAVTIAICHLLFNLFGSAVFLPLSFVPIGLARWLGRQTARRRWVALIYVLVAFFAVPGILILLS